ncbi:hypothetical protein Hanom_Chr07g00582111 [Helianthus anomalus]
MVKARFRFPVSDKVLSKTNLRHSHVWKNYGYSFLWEVRGVWRSGLRQQLRRLQQCCRWAFVSATGKGEESAMLQW